MAYCEHRVSIEDAKNNFGIEGRPRGVIMVGAGSSSLCQIKLNLLSNPPICELPNMSGEGCPISRYNNGEIGIEETNRLLRELFDKK